MRKKYYAILLIASIVLIMMVSCSNNNKQPKVELYKTYNDKTEKYSELVDHVQTGVITYAVFEYGKPFNEKDIGMTVYELDEEKSTVFDLYLIVNPNKEVAVFDFDMNKAGEYEMIVYFNDDKENPIITKRIKVID